MPNGGTDCCGTCWFNARNKGEAGYAHANDPEPNLCTIRGIAIEDPFWTYCTNHPDHRPERDPIPIGPIFVRADAHSYVRKLCQPSPDTEEVRQHLLDLARSIAEQPKDEYPEEVDADEMVVWQLGEFRDPRAENELRRIAAFSPDASAGQFKRTRKGLVAAAREALAKISDGVGGSDSTGVESVD